MHIKGCAALSHSSFLHGHDGCARIPAADEWRIVSYSIELVDLTVVTTCSVVVVELYYNVVAHYPSRTWASPDRTVRWLRNGSWNAFGGKQKVCAKCIHHHPTAEFANVCAHSVHVNKQPLREQRKKRADQPIERWKIEWLWPCAVLSKNNPVRRNEIRSFYLVNSLQIVLNAPNTTCLFVCLLAS